MENYIKKDKTILLFSYLFFVIPAILFLIGWFKLYISIPAVILLVIATFFCFKNFKVKAEDEYKSIFKLKKWIIVIVLVLILNILSGIGGFAFQNGDHNARNAVMHDLIDYKWPVKYNYSGEREISLIGEDGYLSYYFAYWLPSAAVGKIFGFNAANIILFIYQFVGLLLFYYFISRMFGKVRIRYFFIIVAFSGLDVIGQFFVNKELLYKGSHIDTWSPYFCFSSNITQLFWVFNQGVSAWLLTAMLLNEPNFKNLGLLTFFLLLFAPFPSVGYVLIIILFIMFGFYRFNFSKNKNNLVKNIKELFSQQNIMSLFLIILLILFFTINPSNQPKGVIFNRYENIDYLYLFKSYVRFWLLEFGIISILAISKNNYKWVTGFIIFMSIIPFFYIGQGADFVNRVSIPMLIVIMFMIMEKINNFNFKKPIHLMIIIYLLISSVTAYNEITRTIYRTVMQNKFDINLNRNDNWLTYGKIIRDDVIVYFKNFSTPYDKERFVFKYILK